MAESPSVSLNNKRLRGAKGGLNCKWALMNLHDAGDVLGFLKLLEPVALSSKAKKGIYGKFARLVDMRTTDEALAVLIWFAERGGLSPVFAGRLYNRAESAFGLGRHDRRVIANEIWKSAGGAIDTFIHPLRDRTGREMLTLHPFCHAALLDETYLEMHYLRQHWVAGVHSEIEKK